MSLDHPATQETPDLRNATSLGSLDELMGRISSLEMENSSLRDIQKANIRPEVLFFFGGATPNQTPSAYLDEPTWAIGLRS